MAQSVIHKVFRQDTDTSTDFVLVRASMPALADSLHLQATENENAFFKTFPVSTLGKLRAKTYRGSDDEFVKILRAILLDDHGDGKREEFGEFSMAAAVNESQLNISIRKEINGIKTRICVINLPAIDPEEAGVDLFEWAAEAAAHRDKLSEEYASMQTTSYESSDEAEKMKAKFKDFVETKQRHEKELLAKFTLLLNEKKAKIRELMRVIEENGNGGTITVGVDDLSEDENEEEEDIPKAKGKGRGKKRKVAEDDEMDLDKDEDEDAETLEDPDPAQQSDNRSTEDEEEERRAEDLDLSDAPPSPPKPTRGKAASSGRGRGRRAMSKTKSPSPPAPARHTRAHDKKVKSPSPVLADPEPEAASGFADDMDETDDEL